MTDTKPNVKIRAAALWDLNSIATLDAGTRKATSFVRHYSFAPISDVFGLKGASTRRDVNLEDVVKLIDLGLVAEIDGQVVGFILGRKTYLAEVGLTEGEVVIMEVSDEFRGKGIGTKLIDALTDTFKKMGVKRVRIGVNPEDNRFIELVKNSGFAGAPVLYFTRELK
jgi:ribosomal protein S18 acetylase RimI-like enzyme